MMPSVFETLTKKGASARIAVMRYRFIGDTLLTVPFLKTLREALPEAHIDVLVAPNSGEVLEHCPYLNQLIFWDTTRKHRYENPNATTEHPQNFWQSVQLLKSGSYDAIFVLKRSLSSALMAFLAGIPLRVGFATEGRNLLLTHRIPYDINQHEAECYLENLKQTGFPEHLFQKPVELNIWLTPQEKETAKQALQPYQASKNVAIHLTSSNQAKEWPKEHSQTLLSWLLNQADVHVHFFGAPSDSAQYNELIQAYSAKQKERIHNWCGQFTIRESAALLSQMNLVAGVDSGTLHLARAVKAPTIVLFGPMSEAKWAPPGALTLTHPMPCHPCHLKSPCHHEFACIRDLKPETVIQSCQTILKV